MGRRKRFPRRRDRPATSERQAEERKEWERMGASFVVA